jgi:glycerophosphoryl diester phosphodiesterase
MIEIICHRGANAVAPENTMAAAKACVDWGIDYLEIDVRESRDGVFYNLHDRSVDRTTDGTGLLADLDSAEIDRLDAGSWFGPEFAGERVPRVESLLAWARGRAGVYLDVKTADHERLIALVRMHGIDERCFFWSHDDDWSLRLSKLAPDLPIKINVDTADDVARAHERFGARIVEVGLARATGDLLDACRTFGIRVMIYHQEDDADAFRRIIQLGVPMVNLNHADTFLRIARELGARP